MSQKEEQTQKKNKKKQAVVAKWSDSEGSSESENKDEQAHLCLMVNSIKEDDEEDNSKEVLDFLNSCSDLKMIQLNLFLMYFKLNKS